MNTIELTEIIPKASSEFIQELLISGISYLDVLNTCPGCCSKCVGRSFERKAVLTLIQNLMVEAHNRHLAIPELSNLGQPTGKNDEILKFFPIK